MNEPRVVESVTNECQSLGRAHESSSARAEQLIACLEGEIAKRDETIARLEQQLNRSIQVNYDLRAELAAIKAQEPVAYISGCYRDVIDGKSDRTPLGAELAFVNMGWIGQIPLYAAPVSEAKAQGVVMPTVDQAMRVVLREMGSSKHIRGTSNWCADVGRAVLDEVARLNAAHVQQVSVPDGKVCVPVEVLRLYEFMAASFTPFTSQQEQIAISLRKAKAAMLSAPAAPAADAGALADAFLSWKLPDSVRPDGCAMDPTYPHRYGTNLMTWAQAKEMFEYVLVAHRAKGVV